MEPTELSEFMDMVDPCGEAHAYFYRIQARKIIETMSMIEQ
jgi:hypothetical protein